MMSLGEAFDSVIFTKHLSLLNILPCLFVIGVCNYYIFWPIAYFMYGRRFDKLFKNRPCPSINEGVFIWGTMSRTLAYSERMLFGAYCVRNKYYRNVYDGYDFRAHSTKPERIVAWIYYRVSMLGLYAMLAIFLITGWRYVAQFF